MAIRPPTPRPPPAPPPAVWRARLSTDPTEHALLVALRATPDDEASRGVYADWLEQQGDRQRATFVRHAGPITDRRHVLGTDDAAWRALAARTDVQCERACQRRWDALEAIDGDERLRRCSACERAVRYCANRADIEIAASTDAPYVLDADLDRNEVRSWHAEATRDR